MKTLKINPGLLLFIILIICFSSCTHYYYAPNTHNVPLFEKKNEARISASRSTGDEFVGTEFQAAYSVTNNIGIMANGFFAKGGDDYENGKGKLIEFGIGYFKPFARSAVFEIYGGLGGGNVDNNYGDGTSSRVKFTRYFIQPSIGFTSNPFDVAISSRFCGLNFHDISYNYTEDEYFYLPYDYYDVENIRHNKFSLLFEPALTIRAGWQYVKIQAQLGLSANLTNPTFVQETMNFSLGAYFSITDKFQNKNTHRRHKTRSR